MSLGVGNDPWSLKFAIKRNDENPKGRYIVHTKEDGSYNGCVAYDLTDEYGKDTFIGNLNRGGRLGCIFPKTVVVEKKDIDYVELYDRTKLTFND